jgi:hypothetical protein
MELIGLVALAVVGFVAAIVRPLLTDECKAWLPRIIDRLINRAVSLLPEEKRERYDEEWHSHINDLPGDLSRVLEALRFSIAARHISPKQKPAQKYRFKTTLADKSLAAFGIILLSPLCLLIMALIKLDSHGPVLVVVKRYGLNNKVIKVLKFRTTHVRGGDQSTAQCVSQNDPRVTLVGRGLRALSLDELPQLINVLRGELSLVAPPRHETD